ncbi:MAG: gliding motility-associated protein GldE [Bacteroidaceae bacterium]|nr:gliding motility-associated protein GldE [Bacteroidaceae bacterium]
MDYHLSAVADFFSGITLMPPTLGAYVALALGLLLLLCSAFVSGSEIAFFSLSPADMNELEERRTTTDRRILQLLEDTERLLATILCSNNFVNVAIIMLLTFFFHQTVDFGYNSVLEFLTMTVVLTFLLLLFGEIMPKIASAQNPLRMARFCAPAYGVLVKLWWPVSSLLMKSTKLTSRLEMAHQQLSVDDLEQALELTDKEEIADEQQMLKGIIRFGGEMAREVMTPRVDIVGLDIKTPFPEVIQCIVENNYSRIPIYADNEDNIKGILYIKDLLPHLGKPANFRWQTLVRPATFVPETKMIDDLLRDFQAQKVHIAIVVDEFGGTSGLVTMEDIIEEIVGEINDEYDEDERTFTRLNQNTYVFEAKTLLSDFRKIMQLPEDAFDNVAGEADTLAGLLLEIKGEFPQEHERIQHGRFTFEVMEMDERRIVKIKVIVGKAAEPVSTK